MGGQILKADNKATADTALSARHYFDQAETALAQNGRTFHWARRFLGPAQGHNAATLYSLCRLLDDMADGDIKQGPQRLAVIDQDVRFMRDDNAHSARDPAFAAYQPFLNEHNISLSALSHLIEGLLLDQNAVALNTEDELVRYGYYVAGTVGLMMCPLIGCHDETAHAFAVDMGIAMQLTNIARDVLEDAHMGRRYLPATWVDGLSSGDIAKAAQTQDEAKIILVKQAVEKTINLAETYYQSGFAGLSYLPLRPRIAIAIAAKAYRQIGIQLRAHDLNWHEGRTVTSITNKAVQSIAALPKCLYLQPVIAHQATLHRPLEELFS